MAMIRGVVGDYHPSTTLRVRVLCDVYPSSLLREHDSGFGILHIEG